MAGIQVHTASPINANAAAKPDGTTPSTARQQNGPVSAPTPATTAATPTSTTTAAQPGRAAVAAPTGTATSTYNPTPTVPPPTTTTSDSPPPPQPGAVPSPFVTQPAALNTVRQPSIPPPPRAGEVPKPAAYYAPQHSDPQQTASPSAYNPPPSLPSYQTNGTLSTPIRAQPTTATTSTYTGPQQTDLSNPPGYVQNARASFDERPLEPYSPFANTNNNTPSYRGHKARPSMSGGLLDDSPDSKRDDGGEKSAWDTGVSWLKKAGEKLGEAHDEVWRRIDGNK